MKVMKILILISSILIFACDSDSNSDPNPTITLNIGEAIPLNKLARINISGVYIIPTDGKILNITCHGNLETIVKYSPFNTQTFICNDSIKQLQVPVDNVGLITINLEQSSLADLELLSN